MPINLSKNPPHDGARDVLNFHSISFADRKLKRSSSLRSVDNHFFAALKVLALSLTINSGAPLRTMNSFKPCLNSMTVMSLQSLRCAALVLGHVNSVM